MRMNVQLNCSLSLPTNATTLSVDAHTSLTLNRVDNSEQAMDLHRSTMFGPWIWLFFLEYLATEIGGEHP